MNQAELNIEGNDVSILRVPNIFCKAGKTKIIMLKRDVNRIDGKIGKTAASLPKKNIYYVKQLWLFLHKTWNLQQWTAIHRINALVLITLQENYWGIHLRFMQNLSNSSYLR